MGVPAVELAYQLRQTKAFIDTRPVTLVLQPKTPMVSDGSGGKKKATPTPRPAQVFRFVEMSDGTNRLETGSQYAQVATLLGMPSAVIAKDDEFTYDGANWKVDEIQLPNEWEIRATVMRYGR